MKCENCGKEIDPKLIIKESARIRGKVKSEKKKKSSINNGKKGGRKKGARNEQPNLHKT